ncbi:bifunctional 2-polyprenyl-6-hydroxyphenol methylase/3-demethylubiquinol 3-O-methyltransferase UbiG [Micromonospora sp. HM5-17]|uniref:class I SAM-dependent methyltransferase n=1 Tax=Micromonospora sp. HM5-17 TaxID=2487710 RepID=UPI000F48F07A|nr:class I SAM-dependent methyltransferase [Micromonospora sp. HM5-17]ROT26826.1 class I SAM-dependent methyltransferase [Micromonospora sp. HM5-17]
MEATEVRKLAALEDTHWWYRERRALLARALCRLASAGRRPDRALDIGAAGGGNTRVLRAHGWRSIALEYSPDGARIARERGLDVIRADARHLPLPSGSLGLVVAFDILEHVDEDHLAAAEIRRTLAPGGTALIAVPCDMRLWSAHDVAVGHVRRYDRATLTALVEKAGLVVDELWSWNVLLRPVAAWRRRRSTGSDLDDLPGAVNLGLRAVITAERYLPVKSLPGVSLMLRAHRPETG